MGNEEKLSTYSTLGECSFQTLQRAEHTWDLLFKQHCQEIKKKKSSAIAFGVMPHFIQQSCTFQTVGCCCGGYSKLDSWLLLHSKTVVKLRFQYKQKLTIEERASTLFGQQGKLSVHLWFTSKTLQVGQP